MINCKYKQPKYIPCSKDNELNVLSLNIRSLYSKIGQMTDNITDYQKYDVMAFNETNCRLDKLANGIDDLTLEGFHPPIIQEPFRNSGLGGGLAIYVNKKICNEEDLEKIDLGQEHPNSDGEFLFVKIKECKNVRKQLLLETFTSPQDVANKSLRNSQNCSNYYNSRNP